MSINMNDSKVLIVTTSHSTLGDRRPSTGIWLEELAGPYYVFKDLPSEITIASPTGGQVPIDPASETANSITNSAKLFRADTQAMKLLSSSIPLAGVISADFDLIFIVGGHGSMFDLRSSKPLIKIMDQFISANKPIGTVGSGAAALLSLFNEDGTPFLKDKRITAYSNEEVEQEGLIHSVPFLLESELLSLGAFYSRSAHYSSRVVVDGQLVTGQNPASAYDTAKKVVALLQKQKKAIA